MQAPTFDVHPPTPVVAAPAEYEQRAEGHQGHLPSSGPTPIPIPSSVRTSSRTHTPSSSLSNGRRHHPYSVSPSPSLQPRSRPMSSASWSDLTGSETELDLDFDGSGDDAVPMAVDRRDEASSIPLPGFAFAGFPIPPSSGQPPPPPPPPNPADARPPKPKTSHARKTPPGHIKRPPNAFILFRSHCCAPNASPDTLNAPGTPSAQQLADLGITDHRHISRIASHLWKALKEDERGYWEDKARAIKEEHQQQHPDYRYKPIYRKKDEVRRRKQGWEGEVEDERKACEQVASGLLNEVRVTQKEGTEERRDLPHVDDIVAKSLTGSSTNPRPKRIRPKRPPRGAAKLAASSSKAKIESPPDEEADFLPEPQHYDERPHSAPSGDFVVAPRDNRRQSHFRNVSYDPSERHVDSQFSYMHQLNESLSHPPEEAPHFDYPRRRYPELEFPPGSLHQPVAPTGLTSSIPHNPAFSYYPAALPSTPSGPPVDSRPLTPRSLALNQLQHYSIQPGGLHPHAHSQHYPEVVISPTGTTFDLDGGPGLTQSVLAAENFHPRQPTFRRVSETTNLLLSGMKRRGTLTRTTEGGELMLLSPANSSFPGGRKVSLGRWERDATDDGQRDTSHQLSETLTAFEFDESFLHFLPQAHTATDGVGDGDGRSGYSSSSEHGGLAAFDRRPTSSASDFSADDSVAEERQALFHRVNAKDQPHSPPGAFHVGQTEFFLAPSPAQADTPREYVFGTSPAGQPPPLFNHDIFMGNGQNSHRPSIDALLAANSPTYTRYPRGSDATIRMGDMGRAPGRPDVEMGQPLSPTRETAMAIINQQLQGRRPEEFETTQYVYLTAELAGNANLVELILSHGVGVSYDSDLVDAAAQSDGNFSHLPTVATHHGGEPSF